MKLRLCDEDRQLFGCPEWMEWTPLNISIADLDELASRFDFDPEDWPEPFYGQLTLEQAGDPDAKPKPPRWRYQATVWLLLRQNGFQVSWDEAAQAHPLLAQTDVVVDESPGKDPDPSPPSAPSTTRRSRTSTGSRKRPSTA